jgi:hypothetical protein
MANLGKAVMAIAFGAGIGFVVVALHEFDYASNHPYAFGPAKVIAWAAVAGAALAVGVGILGYALTRERPQP